MERRQNNELWLLGKTTSKINGKKLPSNGDVLRRLFYLTNNKNTVKEAANIVYTEVFEIWEKANISTKDKQHVLRKIQNTYGNFRAVQKSKSKRSTNQIGNETKFKDSLNDLFDIAHANALQMTSNEEDRLFLQAQREPGRRGYMANVDNELILKEDRKRKREVEQEARLQTELGRKKQLTVVELGSSNSSSDESSELEHSFSHTGRKTKRTQKHIVTPALVMALDRTKMSDRSAVMVLAATASSLREDIDDIVISRSTLRRQRRAIREKISNDIKQTFISHVPLTIHWDGKIMPDITGNENVDRLPILVSGGGKSKLLGVPKLASGSGEHVADAVVKCLQDWNLLDSVHGMCFDTTASNTGNRKGACVRIEDKLKRQLLSFACRHHIHEIVVSDVFQQCYRIVTGPDIQLFKRFQSSWNQIDTKLYATGKNNCTWKDGIIAFCQEQLHKSHPRADYREVLELTIIYLGGVPVRGVSFRRPGALHRARWMARVIYAIKLTLFRSQFKMTKQEESAMERFTRFAVRFYVPNWFTAPIACSAPRLDLEYIKQLQLYDDKELSVTGTRALCRHLWYLSEELISLAFLDDGLTLDLKRQMVKQLKKPGSNIPDKRCTINPNDNYQEKSVADFITGSSRLFFHKLSLESEFLEVDPSEWSEREDYQHAKKYVDTLQVTNDNAERAVSLIQNFSTHLTKNEEQLQYILQAVENHREQFPLGTKSSLKKRLS